MSFNPLHAIDWYKISHKDQYPVGTELVFSNFTARSNKLSNLPDNNDKVVFFGLEYFVKKFLIEDWGDYFFDSHIKDVIHDYSRRIKNSIGVEPNLDHIRKLHDLQYLPIKIRAFPEGSVVPVGIPLLTIENTNPEIFWLTNYLESVMSNMLWKACTSATTAYWYKKLMIEYADKTCDNQDHIPFQCHDFSFRGMSGIEDAALSGAGHLLSFAGTDTVPAIDLMEKYYDRDSDYQMIGVSVPATEHSVMSMGTKEKEFETFKRLITKIHPTGIVSIVSDTWNLWTVLGQYLPKLKREIMAREGKVVIRPDSGDPETIICGNQYQKGAIEYLWNEFGGTTNTKGYKVLDPHVGLIYGDSITPERAKSILDRLEKMKFASSNIVFGIGSYTYQFVTRDTYGFAVKATAGVVNGQERAIYKEPVTDSGTKKSLKGFFVVLKNKDNKLTVIDNISLKEKEQIINLNLDAYQTVFDNGSFYQNDDLDLQSSLELVEYTK